MGARLSVGQSVLRGVLDVKARAAVGRLRRRNRALARDRASGLAGLVRRARRTAFGRDHGFDALAGLRGERLLAEFRRRVPVADYAAHAPYIERVVAGETTALFRPGERVRMFALTSGTTDERKFLPVTDRVIRRHRDGWMLWGLSAYRENPALLFRGKLALSGDPDEFRTPRSGKGGGVPCGSISGLLAGMQSPIVRRTYCVPHQAGRIAGAAAKYELAWRFALHSDLGSVVTPNPSTLLALARYGAEHAERLVRHTATGGLPADSPAASVSLPPEVAAAAGRFLPPDPGRARELGRILDRTGTLAPADVWPNLDLVGCWTGGPLGVYLNQLPEFYGDARVRDIGLIASEGRTTIPLADGTPAGPPHTGAAFFEFVPEDEIDAPDPVTLCPGELEVGRDYFVLMTTPGGLWRYDIRDLVRCEGWVDDAAGGVPLLSFLNKGRHFSSLTGEKLSEYQASRAVAEAAAACGVRPGAFALAPYFEGPTPRYGLFAGRDELPAGLAGNRFADAVDRNLRRMNCEYASKRSGGRLGPVALRPLPAGAWDRWDAARLRSTGGTVEQYKRPCLIGDLGFAEAIDPRGVWRAAG